MMKWMVMTVAAIGLSVTLDGVIHDYEAHRGAERAQAMMQEARATYGKVQEAQVEARAHFNKCFKAGDAAAVEACMKGPVDAPATK